ncbi:hypothetical protein ACT75_08885 [Aggregatibacter actinomycetemcomitans]|uniref:Lipoprotein n=1 Tax=Aggregatibacter actinomycetemcomitans TaxID=714 RepID=A0A5D0EKZ4_AGGAC|nr:Rz-like spanin [Haemophilus phage Aaphi23]AMQ94622.1 hypothetical protein ACT75_08885 [Aggregatibacter actinomycetemcomitans]MCE3057961.1 hypothetical protein [Aggregatibacter actinomycetemcomitans]TYA21706.1 hypothetical protein FXE08_03115 [Aggregatibacter actinomycetemcomitans]TYA34446.1 hypothetical protein FXB68_08220 [Aggregatibacter actinomycetemcomitans]TYA39498.1 hypothetical protein FXB79_03195 [Aggregatibacter actinomycetemcomitans]
MLSEKSLRKTVAYAIAVLVATSLTACSNLNSNKQRIKIVRVSIPDELLRPCPKPAFRGDSASDIAVYAVKVTDQLKICNQRINQIKSFVRQNDYESPLKDGHSGEQGGGRETESIGVGVDG